MSLRFGEVPRRVSVLVRCYRSEPGAEPTAADVPFALDPASQAIRLKPQPGAAAAPPSLPPPSTPRDGR
jgi:hypothetical protein